MSELSDRLHAEDAELRFATFTLDDAWELGVRLRATGAERALPVAIAIWLGPQRVFHAALPGASADNDGWLDRKHRVVERFGQASLASEPVSAQISAEAMPGGCSKGRAGRPSL